MHAVLADLISLLELERIENNIFRGDSRDIGSAQVFGGQVLGQALSAAQHTVEDRIAHSLHAYFLRRGDTEAPIIYDVDRARDGGSFSNRRVVAIQHGRPIFNLAASFQKPEDGLDHQAAMPDVPGPDELRDIADLPTAFADEYPDKVRRFLATDAPFDIRPVEVPDFVGQDKRAPFRHLWFRTADRIGDDHALHQNLLAYFSDHQLLPTSTLPHGVRMSRENLIMASLDHAMWFHRRFRIDNWLLYAIDSPNASGVRGFSRGQLFSENGTLVASTAQEGLIRVVESARKPVRSHPREQS